MRTGSDGVPLQSRTLFHLLAVMTPFEQLIWNETPKLTPELTQPALGSAKEAPPKVEHPASDQNTTPGSVVVGRVDVTDVRMNLPPEKAAAHAVKGLSELKSIETLNPMRF